MKLDRSEAKRRLRIGAALGLAWFVALLIPEGTRLSLFDGDRASWRMLLLMVGTSALLTLVFPVARLARRPAGQILLAILLPALGALTYAEAVLLFDFVLMLPDLSLSGNPNGPLHGLFGIAFAFVASVALGAPIVAAVSYVEAVLIAVPLGYLHVRVLRRCTREQLWSWVVRPEL